ncbi:MAG: hypothetical protein HY553_14270 [Elusimicrobia bacterium]|nr:hypothetical protein [Elusimicrobiota bacterium]
MKAPILSGVLAVLAAALPGVANASSTLRGAAPDVVAQNADNEGSPTCNISCSPRNLRDSNALMTVSWYSDGTGVTLDATGPDGQSENHRDQPATGSHAHQYRTVMGKYRYSMTCHKADGTQEQAACESELSCFPKGTKVLMCDGTESEIQNISEGAMVKAWDPASRSFKCSKVQRRIETVANTRYKIMTSGGGRTLEITPTHPMWVDGAWRDSSEVKVGSELLYANGAKVKVTSIQRIEERIPVYNLVTEDPHDFFAENLLVHNQDDESDHKDHGFVARTRILMADGRHVKISKLKVGDKIMAWDPKTGKWTHNTVRKVMTQELTSTYMINGHLRVGTGHRIFRVGKNKTR